MWTYLLPTLLLLQIIAVQAHPRIFPGVKLGSVLLQGYDKDGCPTEPNFSATIPSTLSGCTPITSTGITNVVVVANDKLPSTCKLFLFENDNCGGTESANIGPIFPSSIPSACIGPIRNPAGNVFELKIQSSGDHISENVPGSAPLADLPTAVPLTVKGDSRNSIAQSTSSQSALGLPARKENSSQPSRSESTNLDPSAMPRSTPPGAGPKHPGNQSRLQFSWLR
ncbi:hypothetical protein B9Z19DRAFT_1138777 [Tuber borchii]|uniref:Uncharacterized protein n=1 Tax=Tuber borchii TaxID=42251 RepID=A0A2T6Z9P9_TUBBO|nr:hypothetical protein B9Z19DRAFT_1138777 [Tuber borchii]